MEILHKIVLSNGNLDENSIVKREILYKGMNGKCVERFYVSPNQSYVYKPLTNNDQLGKESWAYENILLPYFPPIYPEIIAKSSNNDPEINWIIFGDLGTLSHVYNEETVLGVTKLMALWHTFPGEKLINASLKGPKPFIEEITNEIMLKKAEVMNVLPTHQISKEMIENIYSILERVRFSYSVVLSHGDLHLGNYARSNNRIVVLDWEHMHLNHPFWDLYHVIDLSHPLFPKNVTSQFRDRVLDCYLIESELNGVIVNRQQFKREYYLFSTIFSIWMLLLINVDLNRENRKWSQEILTMQMNETASRLVQCAERM